MKEPYPAPSRIPLPASFLERPPTHQSRAGYSAKGPDQSIWRLQLFVPVGGHIGRGISNANANQPSAVVRNVRFDFKPDVGAVSENVTDEAETEVRRKPKW